MIYFDYNSTAPYSSSVRDYLRQGILEDWCNPSSVYLPAQNLHDKISQCRRFIADYLNCSSKHLFFTGGGTESINTVLSFETLKQNHLSGFISSDLEHKATIKKLDWLNNGSKNFNNIGFYHALHNQWGEIDLIALEELCSQNPRCLLSFLSANNETGVITNIKAISKIAKKYNCLVHVDAVQSLGKIPVDLEDWDVDFASFSGHKIGAMKGIGLLYAKKPFAPLMYGGEQEKALRPGTYNYPAIHSFKLAIQDIDLQKQKYVGQLRDYFENNLLDSSNNESLFNVNLKDFQKNQEKKPLHSFKVNCKKANRLSNTSNIYCGGMSNQAVILDLTQKGLCVSSGSACNTGSPEPSHVITSLFDKDYARSCIRISLSPANTKSEIDLLLQSLKELQQIQIMDTRSRRVGRSDLLI